MFLENDLAFSTSLDGEWSFSLAGGVETLMPVPAAWEAHTADKLSDGPAYYRRNFELSAEQLEGGRLLVEFGAVSFWARVCVNQAEVATHKGLWSPFQVDITPYARQGTNSLEIEVWKPGPRFPIREAVAGFMPDVATAFGGLWQGVRLLKVSAGFEQLRVVSRPASRVEVSGRVAGLEAAEVGVALEGGTSSVRVPLDGESGQFKAELDLRGLARWRPDAPARHTVVVSVWLDGQCQARATRTIGLRDITARGEGLWQDDRPLHLRGVLDWGWQPQIIRPAPSRADVRRQVEQSRELGFNLIKLCLFVPDEATFDAADEAGQYLWLEMPLWLPHLTPEVKALVKQEYEAVFRRVHHHPSIVALSLGCELNAEADAQFLAELHALARAWFPFTLLCDNSGSAEAYGGVVTSLQDFYDYHFYTDPHFFQPLLDHFERSYRPRKPWLFGEFCDADTTRDFGALQPALWWLTDAVALDRDDLLFTRDYSARLASAAIRDGGAALTAMARRQATLVRQSIIEQTRRRSATGGYVVSGWRDTPITTAGIVDDRGELKFSGDDWQRFNADCVLLIERPRRRRWVAGGDRPAYRDPYTWQLGEPAELNLLLSNALGPIVGGRLYWRLMGITGGVLANGGLNIEALAASQVSNLGTIRLPLPEAAPAPLAMTLEADISVVLAGGVRARARNRWSLWGVPRQSLGGYVGLLGLDRILAAHDLSQLDPATRFVSAAEAPRLAPVLACEWSGDLLELVRQGRQVLLWAAQPDRRFTRRLPFWREAVHVFEPHDLWLSDNPPAFADMRFFGVASDIALDLPALQTLLGTQAVFQPVWRRFDARALTWAEYVVEARIGAGRLLITSLALAGGQGSQPVGLAANPWGAWLLARALTVGQGGV